MRKGRDQSHPRRRRRNPPSPSRAPARPLHLRSMSQRVTNQVPQVRPPPSRQALRPRRQHPPPSPRSHHARGRALTRLRYLSHLLQLKRRRGGSPHCHLLQAAESPRCERLRLEVLRRHLELLRSEGRNLQEVERDQVVEREVVEAFLTRSPGPRASLSRRIWCQMTPLLLGRLPALRLGGVNTRRRTQTSSAPLSRRRPPSTGKTGRTRTPGASGVAGTLGVAETAGQIGIRDGEIG